jgi:hypothetical protein
MACEMIVAELFNVTLTKTLDQLSNVKGTTTTTTTTIRTTLSMSQGDGSNPIFNIISLTFNNSNEGGLTTGVIVAIVIGSWSDCYNISFLK